MILYDSFVLDGVRRTSDGYLAAFARVARTGIQVYKGSELGRPDLDKVRVYRPPEEVFHEDALKSFAHRPVTLRHPSTPVTAKNWKRHAGGQTGDQVVRDGEYIRVPMVMMDQGLIDAYEKDGVRELSMGYSTDIKWRTGVTDSGEEYDAVQTAIRGNHLAVVPVARGGDQLRIGDEDVEDDKDRLGHGSNKRGSGGKSKEMQHSTHPLPDDTGGSMAYTDPEDGSMHKISRESDGSYYGHNGKFDYSAKTAEEMRAKMKKWKLKRLGYHNDSTSVLDGEECPQCGAEMKGNKCPSCGYVKSTNDEGDYTMKLVIDGLPVNMADERDAAIVEKHIAKLADELKSVNDSFEDFKKKKAKDDEEVADAKKVSDAKDGEIAVLKQKLKDAEITPQVLDAKVKERSAVIDAAKVLLGDKYAFDGKELSAIRKEAVETRLGDAAKTMNDGAIEGAFLALTVGGSKPNANSQIGDALSQRPHSGSVSVNDAREAAYEAMVKSTGEAWRAAS